MAIGPGKYDDLCTLVREQAKARGVIVIVFEGDRGSGFGCQTDAPTLVHLPDILESIARQIRADTNARSEP